MERIPKKKKHNAKIPSCSDVSVSQYPATLEEKFFDFMHIL